MHCSGLKQTRHTCFLSIVGPKADRHTAWTTFTCRHHSPKMQGAICSCWMHCVPALINGTYIVIIYALLRG